MKPYPLVFHPILVPRVWGGRALESLGKKIPTGRNIGESWEIADLPSSVPYGRSMIANGELAGLTLNQAIANHRDLIMGDATLIDGGFPLLIKFLDARENLSVQVHPDASYAAKHPEAHLKSEAWIIIKAQPDAVLYTGVKPHITRVQFEQHIHSGEVVRDLITVPAVVGDCHYLPSGTCHALGAGIVVAEIQTPSDTTFRLFDWGRPKQHGRELHIEQALECIQFGHPHNPHKPHNPFETNGLRITPMCETEHFNIERVDILRDGTIPIVSNGLPEVWIGLAGRGQIQTPGLSNVDLSGGTTVLVPAELDDSVLHGTAGAWLLRIRLPSPLKGMIA